jgi:DNA end-binding protein Ku
MAERLVEDMSIKWNPTDFHDTYRDDLLKLIEEKSKGKVRAAPKAKKAPAGAEVIDFAALLERSLSGKRGAKGEGKATAAKARRKPAHRGGASARRAA